MGLPSAHQPPTFHQRDGDPNSPDVAPSGFDQDVATQAQRRSRHSHAEGALGDGYRATDVGNAARLVAAANGRIRYVHGWSRWIVFRDGRWIIDTGDALVTEFAKQVSRSMFGRAAQLTGHDRDELWKWAKQSEGASKLANMIRLARGITEVLVQHEDLDAHPMLLNTLNGTVDLTTGELRPHNPDDLLTMQAPVMFDAAANAPLWRDCLERWQPDPAQRDYLQRVAGSGITGYPVEHFFINLGTGANGKSRFFGAIAQVLGDYYVVPHKSMLVAQRYEQHDTVKADLRGTRLAVGAETQQDDRLNAAQIKDLTGGDSLRARRMREDPWRFSPTWTLFLHTNHRPRISDTSEGIWRRVRLIDWPETIPPNQRDPQLADKLATEGPGILNWLIKGALSYTRRGLLEPDTIAAATAAWRAEEDKIGRFLHDCTIQLPNAQVTAHALHAAFQTWCTDHGEASETPKALGLALGKRGFESTRVGRRRKTTWVGLDLRTDEQRQPS